MFAVVHFQFLQVCKKKAKKENRRYNQSNRSEQGNQNLIYLLSPVVERADGGTDKDSDNSDDPEGLPHHLPRRILGGRGELNEGENQNDPNDINPREWSH